MTTARPVARTQAASGPKAGPKSTLHGVVFEILYLGPSTPTHPALAQAGVRACLAASNAASRSANLPFANPARAMMVGIGNVSKK